MIFYNIEIRILELIIRGICEQKEKGMVSRSNLSCNEQR